MCFSYHGKRICKKTFLFLHCLQYFRFHSLVKHYKKNGLTLRTHGNTKRLPSSAWSIETVERVVKFIKNVAEEQALLLPGRVPGFKRIDVMLEDVFDICTSTGQVSVGYSKFCDLWNQITRREQRDPKQKFCVFVVLFVACKRWTAQQYKQ